MLAKYKKAFVASLSFVGAVIAAVLQVGNILPDSYTPWALAVLALLTTLGVRQVTNVPPGPVEGEVS